jgi:phosphatidylglycerophosphatase A
MTLETEPPEIKLVRHPRLARAIATVGGIGYFPFASGTVASLVALAAAIGITFWVGSFGLLLCALAANACGAWACHLYAAGIGKADPSECVIDEVAGQWLACACAPFSPLGFFVAFLLFRLLDIAKPWPISAAERLRGGVGIMADDLVAGLISGALLIAARAAHLL